jgi:hypothetical protein
MKTSEPAARRTRRFRSYKVGREQPYELLTTLSGHTIAA